MGTLLIIIIVNLYCQMFIYKLDISISAFPPQVQASSSINYNLIVMTISMPGSESYLCVYLLLTTCIF